MTDNHSGTRSRVRRSERAQHFYAARTFSDEEIKNEEQPSNAQALDKKSASESSVTAPAGEAYLPNEPLASQKEAQERYTPNDISAPDDEPAAEGNEPQIDFSAYYRRDGSASEGDGSEPAFAPPIKLDFSGFLHLGGDLIASFFIGGFLLAAVCTPVTYFGVYHLVVRYRRIKAALKAKRMAQKAEKTKAE